MSDEPYDPTSYAGFNYQTTWSPPSAGIYPLLYGASHVLNVTAEDTTITYGNYPVYTISITGLQGGDSASVVKTLNASPLGAGIANSGYYDVAYTNPTPPDGVPPPYTLAPSASGATGGTGPYGIILNDGGVAATDAGLAPGTLTVTPASLSLYVQGDTKTYDGTTDDPNAYESGLVPGDTVSVSASYAQADVGSEIPITINGYTVFDNNNGNNYTVTTNNGSGEIDPESIVIGAVSDTKVYDGTTNSTGTPTIVSGTLYDADADDSISGTQAFESKDVLGANGSTLFVTSYTLTLNDPGNYSVSDTATAPGTITPAPLTLDAVTDSKQYDGGTSSSQTPIVDSSTPVLGTDTVTDLTQAFNSKDVLGTNGSTLSVTGYTIEDGNNGNDYTVTLNTAPGSITPAPLTLDAVTDSKQYDGGTSSSQTPIVDSSTPVLGADTVTGLTQAFNSKDVLGPNGSTLQVTGYSVNDGNNGNDYTLSFNTAEGTITPAPLTINAATDTKQYDGGTSSSGIPTADTLGSDTLTGTQAFESKDVLGLNGSTLQVTGYTINDGNGGADYTVTQVNTAQGTITPAPLTINAATDTKQYDGGTSSSQTPTYDESQVLDDDSVTGLTQAFESKDVLGPGGSTLLVTGYSVNDGNNGANYTVTLNTAAGTITPAPLLLDATPDSKVYDGTTLSTATPTIDDSTQVFEGDSVTGLTQAFASKGVLGTNGSTLNVTNYMVNDGNGGNDYSVTTAPAEGTITPANITLSATSDTKVYDGTTNSGQAPTASQLFSTDSLVATQSYTSKDVLGTNQSTLAINPGYAINDGNGGADYTITNVYGAPGTITPLALTASLTGTVQKVYDGTTTATLSSTNYSLPGVIEGDDVSLNDPTSGTYNNRNAGTGKTVSVTGLQLGGDDSEDYTVNGTAQGAIGIITPAPLTLTAVTDTKTYDGGVSSTGTPTNSPLIGGDSISNKTQSFASKNVLGTGGSTLLVTGYTIDDGNDGANYTVTLVSAPGTINPAPLTIAAVTEEKSYDGTTAATVAPDPVGLVGGDSLSATETFDSKDAGARTLAVSGYTISDGNNGSNYIVTTTTAGGTIDPKALTASLVGSVSKPFDGNASATLASGNYSLSGVISGDSVSLNDPTSGMYDNANAGTNKLVTVTGLALSGDDAANYTVNGAAAANIGIITAPPQPIVIKLPPTDLITPDFEQAAASVAGSTANDTTVVDVFPVGSQSPEQEAVGDSSPITGAGNRDLWTTSDQSDKTCPPNTSCPTNGGTAP